VSSPYHGLDEWALDPASFPVNGSPDEQLRAALPWAVLAPSGHNTQPWLFTVRPGEIDVLADRSRRLPRVDPRDRELTMSCATAGATLAVVLRRFGRDAQVEWAPEPDSADVVARVTPGGDRDADDRDVRWFDAIRQRRTNRGPFTSDHGDAERIAQAVEVVADSGVGATLLTGAARDEAADLVADADRRQMSDKAFRRELAAWMHHNRSDEPDGIRGYSLGYSDLASVVGPLIVRTFDVGKGQAAKNREIAEGAPALVVLHTDDDQPRDWAACGGALVHLLLELAAHGLSVSYLNQPIEVDRLRPRVASLVGQAHPQLLLRAGRPTTTPPPTPRIPVEARLV
jgi:hypothetical protein